MGRLQNKVALITGGASVPGMGSATAKRFAEEGAVVYVTDRDLRGADEVAAAIRDSGGRAHALAHDVTSEADWDRVMATIDVAEGQLDILVNNAGIAILRPIEQLTATDFTIQQDVNLAGVFHGAKRAVSAMRRSGAGGSIINISSVAGLIGVPGCGAYAASKGGVRMLTKVVAVECAKDRVRCNSVHPGMIVTKMLAGAKEADALNYQAVLAAIPMGFMGDPADIAAINLFLASDESRYVTGAEFVVDGGMSAM
jgi:NAD(P)-dependent dehydrogenase (short-subunit alcohol dehydrogenase family)